MKITPLLKAIRDGLKDAPALSDTSDIEVGPGRFDASDIERMSFRGEALRPAFLGANRSISKAAGDRRFDLALAVYVLTEGKDREVRGVDLIETVAEIIEGNRFGLKDGISDPENLRLDVVYAGTADRKGVVIHAVSWTQAVRIGTAEGLGVANDPEALIQDGVELTTTIDITMEPHPNG